jgi:hypothetical protein
MRVVASALPLSTRETVAWLTPANSAMLRCVTLCGFEIVIVFSLNEPANAHDHSRFVLIMRISS